MKTSSRRRWEISLWLLSVPASFFAVLYVWSAIDTYIGSREVSRFIEAHQKIVAERLTNPKVHSFRLFHEPTHSETLVIQFDVDDKATYLLLENDMNDAWSLRFPAVWQTKLRSGEELGNNIGFAFEGIEEALKDMGKLAITGIVALMIPAIVSLMIPHRKHRQDINFLE